MKGGIEKGISLPSAQGGTRTHTLFGSDFESDASTNSTTRASGARGRTRTGTAWKPADFKSATSTNSITRA